MACCLCRKAQYLSHECACINIFWQNIVGATGPRQRLQQLLQLFTAHGLPTSLQQL